MWERQRIGQIIQRLTAEDDAVDGQAVEQLRQAGTDAAGLRCGNAEVADDDLAHAGDSQRDHQHAHAIAGGEQIIGCRIVIPVKADGRADGTSLPVWLGILTT